MFSCRWFSCIFNQTHQIDQRSYLICYIEKNIFECIHKKLLNDPRIWTIILTLDCKEPYYVWTRGVESREKYETTVFKNINGILKHTILSYHM